MESTLGGTTVEVDRGAGRGRPRLGFLGTGWIGRSRLEAVVESGIADVVAVCDPSDERCGAALGLAPGAERSADYEALLDSGLDGVVIATPSALHARQSIAALERGVGVFCQKPLARTAGEATAVVAAARRSDRLLAVDLSYRFTAAARAVREVVRSGALGRIYGVDLVFHNAYGPDKPWFYDPAAAGGGCVMDLGIHLVDLALWALGFPEVEEVTSRLFAGGAPLGNAADRVEDYATARLDLAAGPAVQLACSWRLAVGCDAVISVAFYGTDGGAAVRNVGGSFYDFVAERFHGTARETLVSPPDAWGGRAILNWAARLADGHGFDPENERLVEVAAVLDRIYGR
jgi:predicted dehydrogenase